MRKGTSIGRRSATAYLMEDDVRAIRLVSRTVTNVALGYKYGLHPLTIGRIRNRKTWKYLDNGTQEQDKH